MSSKKVNYERDLSKRLKDPEYAALYLNSILEDKYKDTEQRFLMGVRDIAVAYGISAVAKETKLNRQSLYKILSNAGNPELATLTALLKSLGLRLAVEVEEDAS